MLLHTNPKPSNCGFQVPTKASLSLPLQQHKVVESSPHIVPASLFSRSFPALEWSYSYGRQFSTTSSNVNSSCEVQFFLNNVGPFHGVQSQMRSQVWAPLWAPLSMGPEVLPEAYSIRVFPCGHSLLWVLLGGPPWATGGYILHC